MALEIERKFLVQGTFPADPLAKTLVQGYIAREAGRTVRVRFDGSSYRLTVKGPSVGIARNEFEWTIPAPDGEALLNQICSVRIEKVRHTLKVGDLFWEVDVFAGDNAGLIVAEVELPREDYPFERPEWLGGEVTEDGRYFNAALLDYPFSRWGVAYADLLKAAAA